MDILEEHWVAVEGFPNYVVSNLGTVVNVNTNKEIKQQRVGKRRYCRVGLWHENKERKLYVHRVVAQAFFLNYREGYEVKHISDDMADNTVLNLTLNGKMCIMTRAEQAKYDKYAWVFHKAETGIKEHYEKVFEKELAT